MIRRALRRFIDDSRAVGILLISCTALSLLLSNIPWGGSWISFWHSGISYWLDDAGMALFFFLAGLEIKRELLKGELSSLRRAVLPAAAAIGGMVLPALIFIGLNHGSMYAHGWGIPMATDIAFSLGVASILGSRMPVSLKIFLTALAIIDDLGAILAIAIFYSHGLAVWYLLGGLGIWAILLGLLFVRVPFGWGQWLLGIGLWYCFWRSGVHPTVAGVLFAFAVPTPQLSKWEHRVHFPVNFVIIPLFALANTAIRLPTHLFQGLLSNVSLGILSGLLIGKTLGVTGAVFLMVRTGLSNLPKRSSWSQIAGTGLLAGIGFTMSIFITLMAFDRPEDQEMAKIAVLVASLLAMGGAIGWFRLTSKSTQL
jgi:NhaA family Na+:H+ antiporter